MPRRPRSWLIGALGIALVGSALSGWSETSKEQEAQQRITELKAQIAEIQKGIALKEGEKDALQARLSSAEKAISALDGRLLAIEQAIAEELPRLEALDAERIGLEQELRGEQDNMTRDFRALWSVQEGGGLRIIFGDQSPNEIALNLAYFDRLLNQRNEAIARFGELLARVQANTTALRASQAELARQSEALEQERRQAVSLQEDRQLALAAIEQSLDTDNARVAKLEADRRRLGELLDELQRSLAEMDTPLSYKPFPQARGEMVFPARGKPRNRFGASRNTGDLRWRGWLIPAPEGSPVKAVHYGRVVYADWLRGQGLLLILDHGEGYLSLYGQNRSLRREVGDWVAPGEVIATVGASGGASQSGLYFEIRRGGDPVDPGSWVRP